MADTSPTGWSTNICEVKIDIMENEAQRSDNER